MIVLAAVCVAAVAAGVAVWLRVRARRRQAGGRR